MHRVSACTVFSVCVRMAFTVCFFLNTSLSLRVSVSQFIPRRSGRRRRRVSRHAVLRHGPYATLLGRFAGVLSVPVCRHGLIVPNGGGLGVADVPRLSGVVCGIDEQRLHGEGLQVSGPKVRHVLNAENTEERKRRGVRDNVETNFMMITASLFYFGCRQEPKYMKSEETLCGWKYWATPLNI